MRLASFLAIVLMCVTSALGQQAPASSPGSSAGTAINAPADAPPLHPITPEQVHEILELTNAKELAVQVMRGMMANVEKVFPPYMPQDVIADLEHNLESMNFEPMALEAYQKHISAEDGAKIIAFYKTPAGQRLIATMPVITREMQIDGAKEGTRIIQQTIEQHMDEIKAAAAKYHQEHPDTPTVITPN